MFTILALTALLGFTPAPADTEPTPIDQAMLELILSQPDVTTDLCASYVGIEGAIDSLGLAPAEQLIFVDMVDAYMVSSLEGDTLNLSPEASDAFVVFLHGCSS